MIENVYFVENLHGIQYFLSLYDPTKSNLIVMGHYKALHQFLQEIMPNERKIVIPLIPDYHRRRLGWLRRLWVFFRWRIKYSRLLREVKPPAKAWFLSKYANEHFFIPLGCLSRRGVELKFVDATSIGFPAELVEDQNLFSRLYVWLLGIVGGVRFIKARCRVHFWQGLGLASGFETVDYTPDSWQLLSQKYQRAFGIESENAVLIVDDPIQHFPGINVGETQKRLVSFVSGLLEKDLQVHLKPHYGGDVNSFSGTCLEDQIRILPRFFPVELILNRYQEVYWLFSSASGACPIDGKKYSLANLVVFDSKEKEGLFWELCSNHFGDERAKVEFVNLEPSSMS